MARFETIGAVKSINNAHARMVRADTRLRKLSYPMGAATPLMDITGFQSLSTAMDQTMVSTASQQRMLMRQFVKGVENRSGVAFDNPVAELTMLGTRGAKISGTWPSVLEPHKDEIIASGMIVDASSTIEENFHIIYDAYRECMREAQTKPRVSKDYDRTHAHMAGFVLGVGKKYYKRDDTSGGIRVIDMGISFTARRVFNTLETMKLESDDVVYLINVTEYAASLEAYFNHIGQVGIMYDVYGKTQARARGRLGVRYTYVHPDMLTPDLAKAAYAKNPKSGANARSYRYVLPAIAFMRPNLALHSYSSKPGFKLGKTGRLTRNRAGQTFKRSSR